MRKLFITFCLCFAGLVHSQDNGAISTFGDGFSIYKSKGQGYYITNASGKKIYSNLKFVFPIYGHLQLLDQKANLFYIDDKGKRVKQVKINIGLCGTVPNHIYEIINRNGYYVVTENENFYDSEDVIPARATDSISMRGVDRVAFHNDKKQLEINANDYVLSYTPVAAKSAIVFKDGKQGILNGNTITFFDEVIFENGRFKTRIGNLYGYYSFFKPKYKTLGDFAFGLAEFTDNRGRTGYVDKDGNEYFR